MLLGYGWDNRVEDCRISSNAVGLEIFNAANNVNVLNTMIVQNLGIGLHLHGGQQVNVEGNSFDGNGGPGLFVVGEAALTVQSNYFEASCSRPMVLAPRNGGENLTVAADIVLSGEPPPGGFGPPTFYSAAYPSKAVMISGEQLRTAQRLLGPCVRRSR